VKRLITYANYQFWVFAVGGGLFALAYGTLWSRGPLTTAPYELAIELDPSYALGHYNLGVAEQQAGLLEDARRHYVAAREADPHDHTPCVNHAQVAFALGRLDEALEAARCAVEHDGGSEAYDVLGRIFVARADYAGAIGALEEALRQRPGAAATRVDLGRAYASLSRFAEAETTLRIAITQRPELAEAWFDLGQVIWKRGDAAGAYGAFQTAVAMDPTQTKAMGNLAALDLEAGRRAAALRWLDRELAIDPANEAAKQLRAELSGGPR
jgi:tetratricopeptide (TPR) repeat protein